MWIVFFKPYNGTMRILRSITDFQVRTVAGQIVSGPVEDLDILERFLTERDRSEIAKVSFYISDTSAPLDFCGIILRNYGDSYIPECSDTLQPGDWEMLIGLLMKTGNLDEKLVKYIRRPGVIVS